MEVIKYRFFRLCAQWVISRRHIVVSAQFIQTSYKVRAQVHNLVQASKLDSMLEIVKKNLSRPETLVAVFVGMDKTFVFVQDTKKSKTASQNTKERI